MKRALLTLGVTLGALCCAPAQAQSRGILSLIDLNLGRIVTSDPLAAGPRVELIDVTRLRAAQLDPRCKTPSTAPDACRYEYRVGYLADPTNPLKDSLQYSEEIAGEMRRLWQEFEDRSYFHLQVSLNNALISSLAPPSEGYLTACDPLGVANDVVNDAFLNVVGLSKLDTARALPYRLQYQESDILPGLRPPGALKYQPHIDRLSLFSEDRDWLGYLTPREDRSRRCAGVPYRIGPDYVYPALDPNAAYGSSWKSCFFAFCPQSPNYPGVEVVNYAEVNRRALEACGRMAGMYTEYVAEALKTALARMPLALHWDGPANWHFDQNRSGLLLQPLAKQLPDPLALPKLLKEAADLNLNDYYAWTRTPPTQAEDLKKRTPKLGYPGLKPLEEAKRLLDPISLLEQERLGVVPFFGLQAHGDVVISKRTSRLYTVSFTCVNFVCTPLPSVPILPMGLTVSPTGCVPNPVPGSITYVGPRMHAKWYSVPEGYHLPDVLGEVKWR